jgi:hypothetical protein
MTPYVPDETTDDVPFPEACRRLEEAGAAVVGINCGRGPRTMLPLLKEIKNVCQVGQFKCNQSLSCWSGQYCNQGLPCWIYDNQCLPCWSISQSMFAMLVNIAIKVCHAGQYCNQSLPS